MGSTWAKARRRPCSERFFEETGVHYEIERLAFIHENFFRDGGRFEGLACHEVAFYYLMKPKGNRNIHCESVCSDEKEFMELVPLGETGNRKAFPAFFKEKLKTFQKPWSI